MSRMPRRSVNTPRVTRDPVFYPKVFVYQVESTRFKLVLPQAITPPRIPAQERPTCDELEALEYNAGESELPLQLDERITEEEFIKFAEVVNPWLSGFQLVMDQGALSKTLKALETTQLDPELDAFKPYLTDVVERITNTFALESLDWCMYSVKYSVPQWMLRGCESLLLEENPIDIINQYATRGIGTETICQLYRIALLFSTAVHRSKDAPKCYCCGKLANRKPRSGVDLWLRKCQCGQLSCLVGPQPKEHHIKAIVQELISELLPHHGKHPVMLESDQEVNSDSESLVENDEEQEPPRKKRRSNASSLSMTRAFVKYDSD
ncbi:hypothetical protein BJ165DRAFT_1451236 [Panaeolus papilionaceus]|nr:hypothetical protein BJ165DRAFT_1451236 [Panaeolus papilionaceus]